MKRKKLLHKLKKFFDMDAHDVEKRKDELNDLLSRLKKKELELKASLDDEQDDEKKAEISQKIDVVHTQRKKGVGMLKDLHHES